MKKEKIDKSTISTWKVLKKIRNNWNGINPVTKILNNKKKDYIPPDDDYDDWYERYGDFDWEDIDGEYY